MKNDSINDKTPSRMMSDEQTDSLLRDFFRLEVPTELSRSFRRVQSPASASGARLQIPEINPEQARSRSVRMFTVAASVAAMALAILIVVSGRNSVRENRGTDANRTIAAPVRIPGTDEPMLVSPEGDARTSEKSITPDGVTLDETDNIELHR